MSLRTCADTVGRGCFATLPETDFALRGRNRDGTIRRCLLCKPCQTEVQREWAEHNPENVRAIRGKTYRKHREDRIRAAVEYERANPAKVNARRRSRHAERFATDPDYRARRLAAWARYRRKRRGG